MYNEVTGEPITPNHLLFGRRLDQNDGSLCEQDSGLGSEHVKQLIDQFWKRWLPEYVFELREQQKKRCIRNESGHKW